MNFELAKALKEEGFPQTGNLMFGINGEKVLHTQDEGCYCPRCCNGGGENYYIIPTLEELIGGCGDKFYYLIKKRDEQGKQYWSAVTEEGGGTIGTPGKTPAEAVAKLWLRVNGVRRMSYPPTPSTCDHHGCIPRLTKEQEDKLMKCLIADPQPNDKEWLRDQWKPEYCAFECESCYCRHPKYFEKACLKLQERIGGNDKEWDTLLQESKIYKEVERLLHDYKKHNRYDMAGLMKIVGDFIRSEKQKSESQAYARGLKRAIDILLDTPLTGKFKLEEGFRYAIDILRNSGELNHKEQG